MNLDHVRGAPTAARGDQGAGRARLRLVQYSPQEAAAALASARDGADPVVQLASAVAALLDAIARNAPDDPNALIWEVADLLGGVGRPGQPPGEPGWPDEPLTPSETRVLHYLPTHMSSRDIAVELCVSSNTVRTHLRHLYQKLGAHSRREVVRRARAAGLLAASSHWP
jgi:LuxR family transcriptional regulator, maltose regulon positive regulatory protein